VFITFWLGKPELLVEQLHLLLELTYLLRQLDSWSQVVQAAAVPVLQQELWVEAFLLLVVCWALISFRCPFPVDQQP
jgi:hypothetical protein